MSVVAYVLGIVVLLFIAMYLWVSSLNTQVRRRTQELDIERQKLRKRVQEQDCLAAVIETSIDLQRSLPAVLQAAVNELPAGWSFPDVAVARIEWEGEHYVSGDTVRNAAEICAEINCDGLPASGRVCVAYRVACPQADQGPFLNEECALLNTVAARLSGVIQRRTALAKLRESEERFRALIDNTPLAISLIEDGRFVRGNRAALDMLGYAQPEDFLGKRPEEISPAVQPDGRSSLEKAIELVGRAFQEGAIHFEWTHLRADGTPFIVKVLLTAIRQGGKDLLFTIWEDITEQKRLAGALADYQQGLERLVEERTAALAAASDSLRRVSEEQQTIFDTATSGIALLKDRVFIRANRRLHEMFGWAPGEMIGHSTAIWYPDEEGNAAGGDPVYAEIWQGRVHRREQELVRADGARFWARLTGHAVDITDHSKGTVWVVDDITAERAAIAEMARAQRLAEEAAQAKSDFLANMSHEIRTPMNAVIGMTHLVLKTELNVRQREYLQKIHASSLHLLGLLNDILDFSKMDAGKMVVEHIDFDLEKVLGNAVSLIAERAGAKGLEVIVQVDPDVPEHLQGDPLRVGQVLANYLNNAVKFTEAGEIALRVSRLDSDPASQELHLRFSVRDTGIGLDDIQRSRLFQSFQQADTSTTRKYGGTGLGLAICRRLAELMGGEVGVDSRPGAGADFWFTLRCGRGQHIASRHVLRSELVGKRLLVVDDNDYAREVISGMLRGMSFEVDTVAGGEQAVTAVAEAHVGGRPYAVVFLDWQMPGMDGIETARRIHALDLTDAPHLLMVTAYGRDELVQEAESVAITDVLNKPVTPSMLFEAVLKVFGVAADMPAPAIPVAELQADPGRLGGARVLLAEDNPLNQEVAIEFLHELGLVVDLAEDGRVAVDKAAEGEYDLVLMDMQMPEMDGLEATRQIRKLAHCKALPIVAMTANALPGDRERCIDAGMNDHLAKPISPDALQEKLLRWIDPQALRSRNLAVQGRALPVELPRPTLADIPGLDAQLGLRQVLGRESLYLNLLGKFVSGQADLPRRLGRALDQEDWTLIEREAHTLKGVSAQVGALEVRELAEHLERAVHDRQPRARLDELLADLSQLLPPLLSAIAACLPVAEGEPPGAAVLDRETLLTVGRQLLQQLDSGDFGSEQTLVEHVELFRAAFGERYGVIRNAIHNFDFDAAIEPLRAIMAECEAASDSSTSPKA